MKNKKLFVPAVLIGAALAAMALCAVIIGISFKPMVLEQSFPFSITYELNGTTETMSEVYEVHYVRNDGYADTKTRVYEGRIAGTENDDGAWYTLSEGPDGRIVLITKLYADYLMGDSEYDYFDDEPFAPQILYYDDQEIEYTDEETLAAHGVKLVGWEYPAPVENSFVFSHISHMSNAVVIPMVLIALLTLIAFLVFVKKDREPDKKPLSMVSVILNFVVFIAAVPVLTIYGIFVDINGGSAEWLHQMTYLLAPLTILGIAASIGLRRKGYDKSSCLVQFAGPVLLAVQFMGYAFI